METKTNDNLSVYNALRNVPTEAQKEFNNGRFKGTDINPMWRIKVLTEMFGMCGVGWYWSEPQFTREDSGDTATIHCKVALYIKTNDGWSQPIWGVGGNTLTSTTKDGRLTTTDEAYKMAFTDACSIAAKQVGCGADIWYAKDNDRTKYTTAKAEAKTETKGEASNTTEGLDISGIIKKIESCKTAAEVTTIWRAYPQLQSNVEFKAKIVEYGNKLKNKEAA